MKFYLKIRNHYNEVKYNPWKNRGFVVNWYNKIKKIIEINNRPDILKYTRIQKLNIETCNIACINRINMHKKVRKELLNDI